MKTLLKSLLLPQFFKSHLLQRHQKTFVCGKGFISIVTMKETLQPTKFENIERKEDISQNGGQLHLFSQRF